MDHSFIEKVQKDRQTEKRSVGPFENVVHRQLKTG